MKKKYCQVQKDRILVLKFLTSTLFIDVQIFCLFTLGQQKVKSSKLTIREQLVFTLVRLRRRPTLVMLCTTFGISTGSGSKIFMTWMLFLEKELEFLIKFSSLSGMEGLARPKVYRDAKYMNLRGVIDCTVVYIEKHSMPSSQRRTYSTYKSYNTFKLLVSLFPICHFNFVSKLFTGFSSDKELVRQSGLTMDSTSKICWQFTVYG